MQLVPCIHNYLKPVFAAAHRRLRFAGSVGDETSVSIQLRRESGLDLEPSAFMVVVDAKPPGNHFDIR